MLVPYLHYTVTKSRLRHCFMSFCFLRKRVRNTCTKCVFLYWTKRHPSSRLPLLLIPSWALAIDPLFVACAVSSALLLPRGEEPLDGCFRPQGDSLASLARALRMENFLLILGSSIADDVAHDTKKRSIASAQEGINSTGDEYESHD